MSVHKRDIFKDTTKIVTQYTYIHTEKTVSNY